MRKIRLYTDIRMLDHVPPPRHPERPERLQAVLRQLERTGLDRVCSQGSVRPATDDELLRVHSPDYLASVSRFSDQGGGAIEADTWVSSGSILAARLSAGAAVQAVEDVVFGQAERALCLVRPPGHHARPTEPMGFCLYASISVAAAHAVARLELDRLLIVDFDVHHGNGTQEIFYASPNVGFLSIHRYPFYPGTGAADETGSGPALGRIRNVPIRYGTPRPFFLSAFRNSLEALASQINPELVLVSAGFDAHAEDPVGDLGLEIEDFDTITRHISAVADVHAAGRIVSVLEGGYNVPILAGCVEAHIRALGADAEIAGG
jgi:acetoin utilization deacetylase AcuC-like enzyme